MKADVRIRPADPSELVGVMNVLDGALLETDVDAVRAHVSRGHVLVAVVDEGVIGACVLDPNGGARVEAIAVKRRWRDRGAGRALLEQAARRHGRLTAEFDDRIQGFYESVGFDLERDGDRYRGTWRP